MKLVQTTYSHLPQIMAIVADAQRVMHAMGIDQWTKGYPSRELISNDIDDGVSYVLVDDDGSVAATAALIFGTDESYSAIREGTWGVDTDYYASIHRVGVRDDVRGRGVGAVIINKLCELCLQRGMNVVRIDTHEDNRPMRSMLQRNGFTMRGRITLAGGAGERVAYDKLLS